MYEDISDDSVKEDNGKLYHHQYSIGMCAIGSGEELYEDVSEGTLEDIEGDAAELLHKVHT